MTRKWPGAFILLSALLVGADSAENEVGFVSIFDGKTLEGWIPESTDRFSVRNGVIYQDGGTGWLRSAKSYKNFELRGEYRTLNKGADSGILFRATTECSPKAPNWPKKGYQLQVIDSDGNLMLFGHGALAKFDRKTDVLFAAMKACGQWQTISLKVVNAHAEATLNGKVITLSDAIALTEGHLGLQGENGQFEWRCLRIKELPPS